jgi:hypothetical protein
MGQLSSILPQGPEVHCGLRAKHPAHTNNSNTVIHNAWCDGNPPLEPFVELTIRVPMNFWRDDMPEWGHAKVLTFLGLQGIGVIVDAMGHEDAAMVMRVRTNDKDHVYPVLKKKGRSDLSVVVDEPQEVFLSAERPE